MVSVAVEGLASGTTPRPQRGFNLYISVELSRPATLPHIQNLILDLFHKTF
jgi:hypothetical protein